MKTQVKSIIAGLILGTTVLVNAKNLTIEPGKKTFEAVTIQNKVKSNMNLFIDKQKGTKLEIIFKDEEGNVLYEDIMGKNAQYYRTKINMANLSSGNYFIELTDGLNKEVKKIEIK
jgi:major membrane immunogen (membrane-anchored lipoprotein)